MADKKIVDTLQSENQVLDKIAELKAQGYLEEEICVVTSDLDSLSIVNGLTDVDLRSSDGNWYNRFKAFLIGEESFIVAFNDMGFSKEETARYYEEVKKGSILLYIDQEYANLYRNRQIEFQIGHVDPHIGSNLTVRYYESINATNKLTNEVPTFPEEEEEQPNFDGALSNTGNPIIRHK